MQEGGNFVVYDANGNAVFNTKTQGDDGAWLDVQSDGNVVIYIMKNDKKTWVYQTQTNFIGPNPIPSVQWQVSTDGGMNFTAIGGATTPILSFTAQMTDNGNLYMAVFTNSYGSMISAMATLTVNNADTTKMITGDAPDPIGQE